MKVHLNFRRGQRSWMIILNVSGYLIYLRTGLIVALKVNFAF